MPHKKRSMLKTQRALVRLTLKNGAQLLPAATTVFIAEAATLPFRDWRQLQGRIT